MRLPRIFARWVDPEQNQKAPPSQILQWVFLLQRTSHHRLECTRAELEEMLAVCVYMGGGPALMYAAEAITAWDKMHPGKG
jgi:hypothetical protein